jgi:GTPase SAR1 family protein
VIGLIQIEIQMNSSKLIYKIVVLGEGRVGKTSMTLKYAKNEFNDNE